MRTEVTDSIVSSSSTSIAIRDFGGDGATGVLLIHGLSRTLVDWTVIAPLLATRHRVVALDVRGHGRSGDGPWSWSAAVDDVTAVVEHCRIVNPAVMGHSLGGMIASMWGLQHPDCAGVVNLDGHGNPRVDQYLDLDPGWVALKRAELEALQSQQLAVLSGPLTAAQIGALTSQQSAVAESLGAPAEMFVESLQRMLEVRGGMYHLRPAPDGLGREIYDSLDQVKMLDTYLEVACPLLLFNAIAPEGGAGVNAGGPPWIAELTSAFRRGQARDLAAVAAARQNVLVETVTGTHGLLFEQPQVIADRVLAFLAT